MNIDSKRIAEAADAAGFVRNTYEKVLRLTEVLRYINEHPIMRHTLALKGGTAINLMVFDLPRLSVDIDLDYCSDEDKGSAAADRNVISEDLRKFMAAEGYVLSPQSRSSYSLDGMIFSYTNTSKARDNIKIEINYSMRAHIYPPTHRALKAIGDDVDVLTLDVVEIFGSKIKALLDRGTPRDLYDVDKMLDAEIFSTDADIEALRKCAVFYMAVGSKKTPLDIDTAAIDAITPRRIRTELAPVLRRGEVFVLDAAKIRIKRFLAERMQLTDSERRFLQDFRNGDYRPEALFDDEAVIDRIRRHPMAMWKTDR